MTRLGLFWAKIGVWAQNHPFWPKIAIFGQNDPFRPKIAVLAQITVFDPFRAIWARIPGFGPKYRYFLDKWPYLAYLAPGGPPGRLIMNPRCVSMDP